MTDGVHESMSSQGSSEHNKARVQQFFEAMNTGDVDAIVASYADHGTLQTMGHTLISGQYDKAQISAAASGIYQAFPEGIRVSIDGMVAEGDKVAVEARSEGRHASGSTYRNEYHFLFTFDESGIVKLKEYMDTEPVTDILCGGARPQSN